MDGRSRVTPSEIKGFYRCFERDRHRRIGTMRAKFLTSDKEVEVGKRGTWVHLGN